MSSTVAIRHLFVSGGHNYFGHHGRPAGAHPALDVPAVRLRAGQGIEGDRFFGYREDYRGQVTFFSWEVIERAKTQFGLASLSPAAVRRNIIVERLDLPSLIGTRFTLGNVEFEGTEESRPCYWMNDAVAPGAETWLRGNGGLRARVRNDGELRVGPVEFGLLCGQAILAV